MENLVFPKENITLGPQTSLNVFISEQSLRKQDTINKTNVVPNTSAKECGDVRLSPNTEMPRTPETPVKVTKPAKKRFNKTAFTE